MTADDPSTLEELVARLADGDRSAFAPVFRRLWTPTLRLCRSMLRNEADAADAAQTAMEKILTLSSRYDRNRPALPWALGIAAWECRTITRRRKRRREVADEVVEQSFAGGGEDEIVQRDLVQVALEAIGELSEADRETVIATFWDEAASVRGATLRKRRERAMVRLRQAMRRLYGFD
jgi:RNA polymerase sigma-70 factor (ECF subfamily)